MKLRTPLPNLTPKSNIDLKDPILTIGSCFSDSIGGKLLQNKFDVLINPFGTIFDPLSITRLLTYSIKNESPNKQTYVRSQGVYKNLELHSSFNGLSKDELSLKIKARIDSTHSFLRSAKWLIISLGTAHVYQYKKTGSYIANCQKLPAANFIKHLTDPDILVKNLQECIDLLKTFSPAVKFILTVSPIRHLRDGLEQNNLSKSILRIVCNEITSKNESVLYYPSYEIMMDDLRDYRFYKADMIHPTEQAIAYIWQHFHDSLMNKDTIEFINEWRSVREALTHNAFNPTTDEHQRFLAKTLAKLRDLESVVNVQKEIGDLEKQIITT